MSNLEIARCTVTIETAPPLHQYGWVVRGVGTFYCLPFRTAEERERFVQGLAAHLAGHAATPVPAAEVDALAALLCLSRSPDEAAYHVAALHLEREFAGLLDIEPAGELDDAVDRLLAAAADGRPEVPS